MKIFKRLLFILLTLVAVLIAYIFWQSSKTIVVINNQRSEEFTDVVVEVFNQKKSIDKIYANSKQKVIFYGVGGESDITLKAGDLVWSGGYVEGGYRVAIIITDGGIESEYITVDRFLLGLY